MEHVTRTEFGHTDSNNVLASMSPREIAALAFGAIQLDASGQVLAFNQTESNLTERRKNALIGRNFFDDVAPCCNTPAVRGVFDAGVKAGKLNAIFDYTFDGVTKPICVRIHMKNAVADSTFWVFLKRLHS